MFDCMIRSNGCKNHRQFDHKSSSTFKDLVPGKSGVNAYIQYGTGDCGWF